MILNRVTIATNQTYSHHTFLQAQAEGKNSTVEWMTVDRTLTRASLRLFSSSARCRYAQPKVTRHVLRDYNLNNTFRYSILEEANAEAQAYPWISTTDLQRLRAPPRGAKMFAREYSLKTFELILA